MDMDILYVSLYKVYDIYKNDFCHTDIYTFDLHINMQKYIIFLHIKWYVKNDLKKNDMR
jgi:hypothetical protein